MVMIFTARKYCGKPSWSQKAATGPTMFINVTPQLSVISIFFNCYHIAELKHLLQRQKQIPPLFYYKGNQGPEKWGHLPNVVQLKSGKAEQQLRTPDSCTEFSPYTPLSERKPRLIHFSLACCLMVITSIARFPSYWCPAFCWEPDCVLDADADGDGEEAPPAPRVSSGDGPDGSCPLSQKRTHG